MGYTKGSSIIESERIMSTELSTFKRRSFLCDAKQLLSFLYGSEIRTRNTIILATLALAYAAILEQIERSTKYVGGCGF